MKRKWISAIVCLCMLVTLMPFSAFASFPLGDMPIQKGWRVPAGSWMEHAETSWYNETDTVFLLTTAA